MPPGVVAHTEVALLRLVAQRLVGPQLATPGQAVADLGALQGQDYAGVLTSAALRTPGRSRAAVEQALDGGELVRSWPMRGTLHLVPAADLSWMLSLTAARTLAGAATRRAALGLDATALARAETVAVDALRGGGRLTRDELLQTWARAGVSPEGQRGYHLLWHLAHAGVLCFGPLVGTRQAVVLVDEWVRAPRRLTREQALGEWARRYFRGHGPATVKDFVRWTGLRAADVREAVGQARPHLVALDVDGVEHLLDPQTPERLKAARGATAGVLLLPGFDELVLGYADRTATLPAVHADRVVPGGNGMFLGTVVAGGQVVGTWRHTGSGRRRTLAASLFPPGDAVTEADLAAAYEALPR